MRTLLINLVFLILTKRRYKLTDFKYETVEYRMSGARFYKFWWQKHRFLMGKRSNIFGSKSGRNNI